jgi:putative transposase
VKGRKRQLMVDSLGLVIRVLVHPANVQDRYAVRAALLRLPLSRRWARVVVDAGYDSPASAAWGQGMLGMSYEVVPRAAQKGFTVQPRRWVVERTFAWLGKYRRLSKDYEALPTVSEALIYVASIHLLVRRLARSSF